MPYIPDIIKELPALELQQKVWKKGLEIRFYCQKCNMTLKHSSKDCRPSLWSVYPVEYFEVLGEEWLNIGAPSTQHGQQRGG